VPELASSDRAVQDSGRCGRAGRRICGLSALPDAVVADRVAADDRESTDAVGPLAANESDQAVWTASWMARAVEEMKNRGFSFVHEARLEPWGQTVARFVSPEGLLVGLSY